MTPSLVLAAMALSPQVDSFATRRSDWRFGSVVYQVMPDRFAPSKNLEAKKAYYKAPRKLNPWSKLPVAGHSDPAVGYWTHELEFWGGDLDSVADHVGYVKDLGADVLYLTPIFEAFSNHKYDATDYLKIDEGLGGRPAFDHLKAAAKKSGLKLILDGVFNHIGKNAPLFQGAKDPKSPNHAWFNFDKKYPLGYESYYGVISLPAWNLKDRGAQNYLWAGKDSVVQKYLREGIDGWRLDVAYHMGPEALTAITKSAHSVRPDSVVVGEVPGYPSEWKGALDGLFNFFFLDAGHRFVTGDLSPDIYGHMLEDAISDAGIDSLLKHWLLTDNHDTDRLASIIPDDANRRLVQGLQMTLPGSPVIYYGSELGQKGAGDPGARGTMDWSLVNNSNENYTWIKKLISIRKQRPALRFGDMRVLRTKKLLAFTRFTDRIRESAIVVVNPSKEPVTEAFATRYGWLMSWGPLKDLIGGSETRSVQGIMTVTVPAKSIQIYVPNITEDGISWSPERRIP